MWTYLNTPFLYTHDGFTTEEIPSIQVEGETWRRLKVTFPDSVRSHTKEQISCFGPDGLLRRHDYTVDILGGATGLNYASDYRNVDGIIVPTKRRVYAYEGDYQLVSEPLLVAIDMGEITLFRLAHVRAARKRLVLSLLTLREIGTMSKELLFSPLQLGAIRILNRIIMAPLTRMRAGANSVPTPMNARYYAQRASAGLIISEGTAVSPDAHGYPSAPGIYTAEQIAGWRVVTDAVHARGGRIIMQIAHNGRNSHFSLRPDGSVPVAPSAIPGNIPALTKDFQQVKAEIPRALETAEIPVIVGTFRQAALNAIEAGFDGVELQGANSHLVEQFLEDGTNTRTDNYGGSRRTELVFFWTLSRRSVLPSARIAWGCVFRPSGNMAASTIAIPRSCSAS